MSLPFKIGINYTGQAKELKGCVNDAKNVRKFLMSMSDAPYIHRSSTHTTHFTENWNFKPEDIMVLTDDNKDPRKLPTKANMLNAMKWLIKDAKAHDSLFFHCE